MELLQLKYFADAAKTENFSHTAKKNMVPPSTISQSIKRLEDELGVSLFERKENKVLLNDNGKIFQKGVDRALTALHDAKLALLDGSGELNGEIRLLVHTNRRFVTKCISDFKQLHPNVDFSLHHEYFGADYDNFDIWIDDGTLPLKGLDKKLLVTENILLAISKEHPLAAKTSVQIQELAHERFISMPKNGSLYKILLSICRTGGFEPRIAIQCDDPYYIRKYVEMNMGIALFPGFSWEGMFDEKVAFLEIRDVQIERETYVYWKTSGYIPNAAQRFISYLMEKFPGGDDIFI